MIKIKCVHCGDWFNSEEIGYSTEIIKDFEDVEKMKDFAESSGVRLDCPKCDDPQYLSDCELC